MSNFNNDHNEWINKINNIKCTVNIRDPQQLEIRSITNPNPPILFLVVSVEKGFSVRRRYSDFEYLRQVLLSRYSTGIFIPPLPEKKILNKSDDFLRLRMRGLNFFIERLLKNPYLKNDVTTQAFLCINDNNAWNEHKKENPPKVNNILKNSTTKVTNNTTSNTTTAAVNALTNVSSFFSSFSTSSTPPAAAAASSSSTGTNDINEITSSENTITDDDIDDDVNVNEKNESEVRWRDAVKNFNLPENSDRLINDIRSQLNNLETVMKQLSNSSSQLLNQSIIHSNTLKDFNNQYDQVIKVESTSASKDKVEYTHESSVELLNVLKLMGNTFKDWSDAVETEPKVLETLLHEVLRYELLCIKELKRLLLQRDQLVTSKDKFVKLERQYESDIQTLEKTGKMDKVNKLKIKLVEIKSKLKNYEQLVLKMDKALFLDTFNNFYEGKIKNFKELIGKLSAAYILYLKKQQQVFINSLENLSLNLDEYTKKASIALENENQSNSSLENNNNDGATSI